jgi:DNA helicase-2/ATP-dependent DNA helicase PcrA
VNPADQVAFRRVWNTPRRGLGPVVRSAVESRMAAESLEPLAALRALTGAGELTRAARAGAESLIALMEELAARLDAPVDAMLSHLLERSRYLDHLAGDENAADRVANVEELLAAAEGFAAAQNGTVRDFLAEAALVSDADRVNESTDRVLLLTAHNAKGLEFPVVVVAGLEEGLFPHANSIEEPSKLEEERRLFYVALTRAKDQVVLTAAAYRRRHDGPSGGAVSRFVDEIPGALLQREDRSLRARVHAARSARDWDEVRQKRAPAYARHGSAPEGFATPAFGVASRALGREVYHESFGRGVVMAAEGSGDDLKYTVRFGTRIKKVLGRFLTEGGHGD